MTNRLGLGVVLNKGGAPRQMEVNMTNHDSDRSARKEQIRGKLPLQTAQEQSVENDTAVSSVESESDLRDLQTGWKLELAFRRTLARLVEQSNPQGQKAKHDTCGTELGNGSTLLDKREPYWVLLSWTSDVELRLLIEHNELNDIDSYDVIIFQVQAPKATSYKTLGKLCFEPCFFTPDLWWMEEYGRNVGRENDMLRDLRKFPHDWRADFAWMVSVWGRHRLLSMCQETVRDDPYED